MLARQELVHTAVGRPTEGHVAEHLVEHSGGWLDFSVQPEGLEQASQREGDLATNALGRRVASGNELNKALSASKNLDRYLDERVGEELISDRARRSERLHGRRKVARVAEVRDA